MATRYFVPRCLLKRRSIKLTKLQLEQLAFAAPWKLIRSHAVTSRWLDDCKECIQSGWSKQRDCCSLADQPRMLVASKAAFLEKLFGGYWLALAFFMDLRLNATRRSINLSVYLVFDLEAGQISGWKSAWRWSGKWAFHHWLLLITCSKSPRKTHQIAQIRHFEPQKFCNEQKV